jgi:hypothetical protein
MHLSHGLEVGLCFRVYAPVYGPPTLARKHARKWILMEIIPGYTHVLGLLKL